MQIQYLYSRPLISLICHEIMKKQTTPFQQTIVQLLMRMWKPRNYVFKKWQWLMWWLFFFNELKQKIQTSITFRLLHFKSIGVVHRGKIMKTVTIQIFMNLTVCLFARNAAHHIHSPRIMAAPTPAYTEDMILSKKRPPDPSRKLCGNSFSRDLIKWCSAYSVKLK